MSKLIQIKTEEGAILQVELEVLENVSDYFVKFSNDTESLDTLISFPSIRKETMDLIIEWATYHKDDDRCEIDQTFLTNTETLACGMIPWDWDKEFMAKLKKEELFDILMATIILDIKELYDLAFQHIMFKINGKSLEAKSDFLGI